jgi:hypothetical protein
MIQIARKYISQSNKDKILWKLEKAKFEIMGEEGRKETTLNLLAEF